MKAVLLFLFSISAFAQKAETVMVTCYAKSGSESELARVLARHWTTVRDLKLAADAGHLTLRGKQVGGQTFFVEIFTWRDAAIPDNAPPPVQAIWAEMNQLADKIEIVEVDIIGFAAGRAPATAAGGRLPAR
jgi:hypothetical protein